MARPCGRPKRSHARATSEPASLPGSNARGGRRKLDADPLQRVGQAPRGLSCLARSISSTRSGTRSSAIRRPHLMAAAMSGRISLHARAADGVRRSRRSWRQPGPAPIPAVMSRAKRRRPLSRTHEASHSARQDGLDHAERTMTNQLPLDNRARSPSEALRRGSSLSLREAHAELVQALSTHPTPQGVTRPPSSLSSCVHSPSRAGTTCPHPGPRA